MNVPYLNYQEIKQDIEFHFPDLEDKIKTKTA